MGCDEINIPARFWPFGYRPGNFENLWSEIAENAGELFRARGSYSGLFGIPEGLLRESGLSRRGGELMRALKFFLIAMMGDFNSLIEIRFLRMEIEYSLEIFDIRNFNLETSEQNYSDIYLNH